MLPHSSVCRSCAWSCAQVGGVRGGDGRKNEPRDPHRYSESGARRVRSYGYTSLTVRHSKTEPLRSACHPSAATGSGDLGHIFKCHVSSGTGLNLLRFAVRTSNIMGDVRTYAIPGYYSSKKKNDRDHTEECGDGAGTR